MEFKDYYKILGVDKKATDAEIRKAYKKLAKEFHPDINKSLDAEKKFKEINEAYTVLSNTENRQKYDNLGSNYSSHQRTGGSSDDFNWADYVNQGGKSGQTVGDIFDNGGSVSDFFERIFGGGFSSSRKSQSRMPSKGKDYESTVDITLEEAYSGTARLLTINGEKMEVKFKPGSKTDQVLKISGKGYPGKNGGANGNLLIKINVLDNAKYKRNDNDLMMDAQIDVFTLMLGGEVKLNTLGGNLMITIQPESQNGKTIKLKGQGMPLYSDPKLKGDLYVTLIAKLPTKMTEKEIQLLKEAQEINKSKKNK